MRLWSLHPRYLDPQGLVALWREALLAQAVLHGQTRGYRHHPQLDRFRNSDAPLAAMSLFLQAVQTEALSRGYAFDARKIHPVQESVQLPVTAGQMQFEWEHLLAKLQLRKPDLLRRWQSTGAPEAHPLFTVCPGDIEAWERP
ncbi:MAG: pyrimidine dimer DNA glycosylase/endonuclease V [Hylemonella sp.]|nr:pyrimidine dimer DNA glycosylase/endonuclease V [Hylemonella sp.]